MSDLPGPPVNLRSSRVGENFIEIDWNPPENNGGTPITGYIVKKSQDKSTWTKVASVNSYETYCRASKLPEGQEFYFQVSAENKVGVGEPCGSKPISTKKGASKF